MVGDELYTFKYAPLNWTDVGAQKDLSYEWLKKANKS